MAYATITVSNGVELKQAPLGFSWTVFFFGGIPALIFSFIYNKNYLKRLLNSGYVVHKLPNNIDEEHVRNYVGFIQLPTAKQ